MFWVFSEKEPAEAAAALEASAKSRGQTPLHEAACNGRADRVDLLLKAGAEKARPHRSQNGFPSKFQGPGGRRKM